MNVNSKYVDRPRLIGDRLANHFDDVNPEAKRLWTLVIQLSTLLRERADKLVKEEDLALSRGEIMTLTCLRLSRDPYELRQSEISERILMTSGGVTNLCKKLESRGWLIREKDPDDARGTLYRLTESGIEVANTIIPIIHNAEKRLATCMSDSELETMCLLLERVTAMLGKDSG